jgi:prephenate dehydrogenase
MTERLENRPVGIIGLGDLGGRLAAQEILGGNSVLAFDANPGIEWPPRMAVDPELSAATLDKSALKRINVADILRACGIVHWAVASSQLVNLPLVPKDCTVVLHDSVMNNSDVALNNRSEKDQFVIAHCLMNDAKRVLVATDIGDHKRVTEHLSSIGLAPKDTTVHEHDSMMARSQGIFALLIELGIREELDKSFIDGNLTPSATELRAAVINREANWTPQTIRSILGNPKLLPFVKKMANLLIDNNP